MMSAAPELLIHATTVALGGDAAVLRGPSGAGKSDLALRFLSAQGHLPWNSEARMLVADDQTRLRATADGLLASAPETISGLIEMRGVGIVKVQPLTSAPVRVVIDLVAAPLVPRFPVDKESVELLGCSLPLVRMYAFDTSAPLKLAQLISLHSDCSA